MCLCTYVRVPMYGCMCMYVMCACLYFSTSKCQVSKISTFIKTAVSDIIWHLILTEWGNIEDNLVAVFEVVIYLWTSVLWPTTVWIKARFSRVKYVKCRSSSELYSFKRKLYQLLHAVFERQTKVTQLSEISLLPRNPTIHYHQHCILPSVNLIRFPLYPLEGGNPDFDFAWFYSPPKQIPWECLTLDHDRFLPSTFQFIRKWS
jgi:hypothetical protein